jgi:carbonic anhydrase/acetyltransferase-like protein (isoleucine patch superfamily)
MAESPAVHPHPRVDRPGPDLSRQTWPGLTFTPYALGLLGAGLIGLHLVRQPLRINSLRWLHPQNAAYMRRTFTTLRPVVLPHSCPFILYPLRPAVRGGATKQAHAGHSPVVGRHVFLAHNASVVGQVAIGANSSVWYQAAVRGTFLVSSFVKYFHIYIFLLFSLLFSGGAKAVTIGNNVHLQDGVVVGLENNSDKPTVIGDDVVVGANAVLHACTLRGRNVIGAGAQVWWRHGVALYCRAHPEK